MKEKNDFDLVSLTSATTEGMPPILYAAKYGMVSLLSEKLEQMGSSEKKTALSITNHAGLTALHFAALFGQTEVATILVKHGASLVAQSVLGQTPVMTLFNTNNSIEKIMEMFPLLAADPNVYTISNHSGDTIALLAAERGIVPILEEIKEKESFLMGKLNNHGMSPLLRAILSGRNEAVTYLLQHSALETADSHGRNALHYAVLYGSNELVQEVGTVYSQLQLMHSKDSDGMTALEFAQEKNAQEKVSILKGFDHGLNEPKII